MRLLKTGQPSSRVLDEMGQVDDPEHVQEREAGKRLFQQVTQLLQEWKPLTGQAAKDRAASRDILAAKSAQMEASCDSMLNPSRASCSMPVVWTELLEDPHYVATSWPLEGNMSMQKTLSEALQSHDGVTPSNYLFIKQDGRPALTYRALLQEHRAIVSRDDETPDSHVGASDVYLFGSAQFEDDTKTLHPGPRHNKFRDMLKKSVQNLVFGPNLDERKPIAPMITFQGAAATFVDEALSDVGYSMIEFTADQYAAVGVDSKKVKSASKYHGMYLVSKKNGNEELYCIVVRTPPSADCVPGRSFNTINKQRAIIQLTIGRKSLMNLRRCSEEDVQGLINFYGFDAQLIEFCEILATQLVDYDYGNSVEELRTIPTCQFSAMVKSFHNAKHLEKNVAEVSKYFPAATGAVQAKDGDLMATIAGKSHHADYIKKNVAEVSKYLPAAAGAVQAKDGDQMASIFVQWKHVLFALKNKSKIVDEEPRAKRSFDEFMGEELATLGDKFARRDASIKISLGLTSRSSDQVDARKAAIKMTCEKKRNDLVDLCNNLELPGADKDSPNEFTRWGVREWSGSNGTTFGTEGHTRRSGMSRTQVMKLLNTKRPGERAI